MYKYFVDLWILILLIFVPAAFAVDVTTQSHELNTQYILQDGDRISIKVFGEEDLSMDILLSTNGTFNYPFLGRIQAAGKSVLQLQHQITTGLQGDFLLNPKVTVNLIQFRKFYINGEVKNPGGYDYQPGLTVAKAVAIAGGFTDRASENKIYLTKSKKGNSRNKTSLTQFVGPSDIIDVEQSFF